jgi:hypothetical protein
MVTEHLEKGTFRKTQFHGGAFKSWMIFLVFFALCASMFIARFAPITNNEFFSGLNPQIKYYVDTNKLYASNIAGENGTGIPNSIGTAMIWYPATAMNLGYVPSFFYYLLIVSIATTISLFLVYKYVGSVFAGLVFLLYYPASKIMFEYLPACFPFLILMANLILFSRKKYAQSYLVICLASLFRPEMMIILLAEILVEFKIDKGKISPGIFKRGIFIILFAAIFAASMMFAYHSAAGQIGYNLQKFDLHFGDFVSVSQYAGLIAAFVLIVALMHKLTEIKQRKLYMLISAGYLALFIFLLSVSSQSATEFVRFVAPLLPLFYADALLALLKRRGIELF